jgi:hypothetical protein
MVLADGLSRLRVLLVAVLFGLTWYYLSFRLLWKSMMPLVALLHAERATVLGHLVYGTFLGRYPAYLPKPPVAAPEPETAPAPAPAEPPAIEQEAPPPEA